MVVPGSLGVSSPGPTLERNLESPHLTVSSPSFVTLRALCTLGLALPLRGGKAALQSQGQWVGLLCDSGGPSSVHWQG